jgi:hypothetical protein
MKVIHDQILPKDKSIPELLARTPAARQPALRCRQVVATEVDVEDRVAGITAGTAPALCEVRSVTAESATGATGLTTNIRRSRSAKRGLNASGPDL